MGIIVISFVPVSWGANHFSGITCELIVFSHGDSKIAELLMNQFVKNVFLLFNESQHEDKYSFQTEATHYVNYFIIYEFVKDSNANEMRFVIGKFQKLTTTAKKSSRQKL